MVLNTEARRFHRVHGGLVKIPDFNLALLFILCSLRGTSVSSVFKKSNPHFDAFSTQVPFQFSDIDLAEVEDTGG